MIPEPIRELLDELYERYDTPGFIEDDPISVPHGFTRREDIEIAGFLAATIAWGNRRSIVRNGRKLMELMDRSPYDFTMNASRNELLPLLDFVHRTFNGGDCIDFIGALRGICLRDGSLGGYFEREYAETGDLRTVLSRFRTAFWSADHRPRAEKHLSSIDRGASCKRLCMYLKWMVRDDGRGVDFGLWKSIPRQRSICRSTCIRAIWAARSDCSPESRTTGRPSRRSPPRSGRSTLPIRSSTTSRCSAPG